jgi:hypothetical protein
MMTDPNLPSHSETACVCVCVRACVRACVCVCVCACVCACVRARTYLYVTLSTSFCLPLLSPGPPFPPSGPDYSVSLYAQKLAPRKGRGGRGASLLRSTGLRQRTGPISTRTTLPSQPRSSSSSPHTISFTSKRFYTLCPGPKALDPRLWILATLEDSGCLRL